MNKKKVVNVVTVAQIVSGTFYKYLLVVSVAVCVIVVIIEVFKLFKWFKIILFISRIKTFYIKILVRYLLNSI